jgi:hypothetical protein
MDTDFSPQNELERQLVAAQDGLIGPDKLMDTLMRCEVFMPVYEKHQIGGLQESRQAKPLVLTTAVGDEVLVLFSSPERAKGFVKDYPGYGGGLVTEFVWILEKLGVGYGISLNPGLAVGMDFDAQALHGLADTRPH